MTREIFPCITIDSQVVHGRPVLAGTRVPAEVVVGELAGGTSFEDVMEDYHLTREQVQTALAYAAQVLTSTVHPLTRQEWREWLASHHQQTEGVWLISYKKHTGKKDFSHDEAIEEALCFGWIDSKPRALDDERAMNWFAPRKPGTGWSRLNKERIEKLIAAGLMTPAGLAKVEAAKADGSWNALDGVEAIEIPPDLDAEFAKYEHAAANFAAFPRFTKRAILEWIGNAKRPDTRAKRVEETARLAEQNVRANQWRPEK
jgi:uncharacterized protein YdeI (YjbR/CyaY-like superfamily)